MSLLGFSGSRIHKTMYWKGYGVFPGGSVVKSLPANAGDRGLTPWSWKIPHATEQLSQCTITVEPVL